MNSSLQHQAVCFGEMLWDILPDKSLPGGAPMNVAYHFKKLGVNPAIISKVGADEHGKKLITLLSDNKITTDYVQVDENQNTGMVNATVQSNNEMAYDIVQPSAWDFIDWKEELESLVKEAEYFVFGSLSSRGEVSKKTLYRLLEVAHTKVLDINLRPPHFVRSDIEYLLNKADILKMNIAELELIADWFGLCQSTEERMKLIQRRFDTKILIVTMGSDGAWISDGGNLHQHPGFQVQVADTIGSGDAFLAGFLSGLINGIPVAESLVFASGVGAFIATQHGACPLYEIKEISDLMNSSIPKMSLSSII